MIFLIQFHSEQMGLFGFQSHLTLLVKCNPGFLGHTWVVKYIDIIYICIYTAIKYINICSIILFMYIYMLIPGWWFQHFLMFTPTWGNDPI